MAPLNIQRGVVAVRPLRVLIHSEPKAGKSHLAAGAPNALHIDCEQGTLGFDIDRVEARCWQDILEAVRFLEREDHDYKLSVLDTLDAAERHLCTWVASELNVTDPAEASFGRGWSRITAEWHALTERLATLQKRRGISIVILAHSAPTTTNTPDGDSWAEWRMRTNKKTQELWVGWVEEILFLHQQVKTKKKSKVAESAARVLETREAAAWQAGSRRIRAARVVLPDSTPQACWAALRDAYRDGAARGPSPAEQPPSDGPDDPGPAREEPKPEPRNPDVIPGGPHEGQLWAECTDVAWLTDIAGREGIPADDRKRAADRLERIAGEASIPPRTEPPAAQSEAPAAPAANGAAKLTPAEVLTRRRHKRARQLAHLLAGEPDPSIDDSLVDAAIQWIRARVGPLGRPWTEGLPQGVEAWAALWRRARHGFELEACKNALRAEGYPVDDDGAPAGATPNPTAAAPQESVR